MERSFYWTSIAIGDGVLSPYDNDEFSDLWRILFQTDRTTQGYIEGYLNELAVTNPSGNNIQMDTGAALVDGKFYDTDDEAVTTSTITTPSVSTRVDRVVLRKSWAAQTVRFTIITGVEGAGVPSITQTDGVTWDVPIAQVSITTGGAITLTDERTAVLTPLVGSTSGTAFEEIESISGDGAITSFDFQSIPQTFKHLKIIGTGRIDSAVVEAILQLRFNNDSGANYNEQNLLGSNATPSSVASAGQTEIDVGLVVGASGTANHVSQFEITIPNYRQTTFFKAIESQTIHIPNTTVANFEIGHYAGMWQDTSAISRITLLNSSGGALIAGCRATLYGVN